MDIEEIEDTSSQEDHPPPVATTLPTKKRAKSKKDPPAVAPSTTLTRFLGPAGPPSLSAWEDVNRQCPVCQQTGFSSRSLALHVNNCIDVGQSVRAAGTGEGESAADDQDKHGVSSTQLARKAGSSDSRASGAGNREGGVRKMARKAPSKTPQVTEVDCEGKQQVGQGTAAKKAKKRHGRGAVSARPAASTAAAANKPGPSPRSPRTRMPNPSQQQKPQQQPANARRQALGLARPKGNQAGTVSTSKPAAAPAAAAAAALTRTRKSSNDGAHDNIARAQLLYVLEASEGCTERDVGWVYTTLFPRPGGGETWIDDTCVCCRCTCSDERLCQASCGAEACGAGRDAKRGCAGRRKGRVRTRPASWSAHPETEERGIWPGSWDVNTSIDDCWGDGDGYLTLRRFPAPETLAGSGAGAKDSTRGDDSAAVSQPSGSSSAQASRSRAQLDSAPASTAERFLEVFSRLQPARTALNLPESPPSSPTLSPRPAEVRGSPTSHEDDSSDTGLPQNVAVGGEGSTSSERATQQPVAEGDRSTPVRPVTERCTGGRIGGFPTPLPKRTALETIAQSSTRNNQLQTTRTAPSSAQTTSHVVARSQDPAPERRVARKQSPAESRQSPNQPARLPAQRSVEHPRPRGKEGRSVAVEASNPVPVAPAKVNVAKPSRTEQAAAGDALARKRDTPRVTKAPATQNLVPKKGSANTTASTSAGPARASSATMPRTTSQPAAVTDEEDEDVIIGKHRKPNLSEDVTDMERRKPNMSEEDVTIGDRRKPEVSADRAHESSANPCAVLKPPLHRGGSAGKSGRMIGRLPGAAVTVKRGGSSRESGEESSTSVTDDSNGDNDNRRSKGEVRPAIKLAASTSRQWGGRGSRGALASRASSGLLRSADLEVDGGKQGEEGGSEKQAPSANGASMEAASRDVPERQASQGREANEADVPQKVASVVAALEAWCGATCKSAATSCRPYILTSGSLTVVWEHGATLRSSWSIDDSQVLGKLASGASLKYDAVWYLSPADADCIGVLRYRVVPHPSLAPNGGWISGSGRLRDDPYTIVRASSDDDSANVNEDVQVVSPPSAAPSSPSSVSLSSSDQHPSASSSRRNPASSSNQQRKNERTPRRQQYSARNKDPVPPESSGRHEKAETGSGGQNAAQSQGIPDRRGPCAGERVRPTEKSRGFRSPAGLPSGSPLPTQRRSASKVLPRPSPAVGSFGRPTSPSAKEMEANDTGDKVTCPVCQRGMDHWKTGQRQQHVHNCLLKQPSSTKKITAVDDIRTLNPARSPGSASRSAGRGSITVGGRSDQPMTPRGSGAAGIRSRGHLAGGDEVLLSDPAESPRSTRVSLQGVFSPKPARGFDGTGRGHVRDLREISSSRSSSAFAPASARGTAAPVPNGGRGIHGASSPRGSTRAGMPNKRNAPSGPAECPICGLSFGGRQGQWEREAHIQQCLESSEGMYDSEE